MGLSVEIPQRQLENKILELNNEGFTVCRSTMFGDRITLFFEERDNPFMLKRRSLTFDEPDPFIQNTKKTKRLSFEKFFDMLKINFR